MNKVCESIFPSRFLSKLLETAWTCNSRSSPCGRYAGMRAKRCAKTVGDTFSKENGGRDPHFVQVVGGHLGGTMATPKMREVLVKLTANYKDSAGLLHCSSAFRNGAIIAKLPSLLTSPNTFRL
jgi:hypothetical protein